MGPRSNRRHDIEMPGEDGYALIRKVRALPKDRGGQTPAAALTGLTSAADRDRVLQAGFKSTWRKPVNARLLVEIVTTLAAPALHGSPDTPTRTWDQGPIGTAGGGDYDETVMN